jgi:hypothetical protein
VIILEGPDGVGKSTIAEYLSKEYSLPVKSGEGPPKDTQDFIDRVDRYLLLPSPYIYDRHPVISGPIYASFRGTKSGLNKGHMISFYSRPKLVLVVLTKNGLPIDHQLKEYDTPEHVAMITENTQKIYYIYKATLRYPDFHLVDPLAPNVKINALVEDYLRRIRNA